MYDCLFHCSYLAFTRLNKDYSLDKASNYAIKNFDTWKKWFSYLGADQLFKQQLSQKMRCLMMTTQPQLPKVEINKLVCFIILIITIDSKYFPVSDWLKPHA